MLKLLVSVFFSLFLISRPAESADTLRKLPAPDTTGGKPLMQALNERQSLKDFSSAALPDKVLGEILWAAWGVNRSDGKHTIPTSMNKQDLTVYVLLADGAWKYNPSDHSLELVTAKDIRPLLNTQEYVKDAPLQLVYAGERSDSKNALMHAGSAYQNVGLYAASAGLHNVVRGYFDAPTVAEALNLPAAQEVLISQAVGLPK